MLHIEIFNIVSKGYLSNMYLSTTIFESDLKVTDVKLTKFKIKCNLRAKKTIWVYLHYTKGVYT